MAANRYLYLLHVNDVRCEHCGDTVVCASSARPQLLVAVGANERPIRLPALDALPAPVLMAVRCRCGHDVFYRRPRRCGAAALGSAARVTDRAGEIRADRRVAPLTTRRRNGRASRQASDRLRSAVSARG